MSRSPGPEFKVDTGPEPASVIQGGRYNAALQTVCSHRLRGAGRLAQNRGFCPFPFRSTTRDLPCLKPPPHTFVRPPMNT